MAIVLHQFAPMYGLPNPSPFCIKLETYLRMAGLPYTISLIKGPPKSPTGKAPYVTIDGTIFCDSGVIIEHLERTNGHPVDGKLTLAERAVALAFQRMMEEHLYWAAVFARWQDPDNAQNVRSYVAQATRLPAWLLPLVGPLIRRQVGKALRGHGLGRHPKDMIWKLGIDDVNALGHWLAVRPWCFGDRPTTLDAVVFSFIASIIRTPWDFPLKTATLKHRNLTDHAERMLAKYFPELVKA